MKKKVIIIVTAIFSFFVIFIIGLIAFYNISLNKYDKTIDKNNPDNMTTIVFETGTTSRGIIDNLENSGLIKNKYIGYIYLKLNKNTMLQAGTYELNKGMSTKEIIDKIASGDVVDNSIQVTFIEGKRITNYVKKISETFGYDEESVYKKINDKQYLEELIEKYWFLTDEILNDKLYYALEGYLYPETYRFKEDESIENIITKMLDETSKKLSPYKEEIENSKYSIHEILTMASIIELEGSNSKDRKGVSGVFYNRLESGWSLGSDVTTYYGIKVEMFERDLYMKEIEQVNDYNTRPAAMAGKLPVGPICNSSSDAIIAAIEPTEHDYYYFVADKNGNTYFTKTNSEHISKTNELKQNGLWFEHKEK